MLPFLSSIALAHALEGQVSSRDGAPIAYATVIVSDEGLPVATTATDASGHFDLVGLPAGRLTVRVVAEGVGAALQVIEVSTTSQPLSVVLDLAGCQGFMDVPDPHVLVSPAFLASWDVQALTPACPACPVYRWFWERDDAAPVVLRIDFLPDGPWATVRIRRDDGWQTLERAVSPRRAKRLDVAITRSGLWQLEHLENVCWDPGPEWTIEALASPGYRAVFRAAPASGPLGVFGWTMVRASGLRVRRKDFE